MTAILVTVGRPIMLPIVLTCVLSLVLLVLTAAEGRAAQTGTADPFPAPAGALFGSYDTVACTLSADFTDLFAHRRDPFEASAADADYTTGGRLSCQEDTARRFLPVRLKLRGSSSQRSEECAFPKLSLHFKSTDIAGTIFEGQETVGLATHCNDSPGSSALGRIGGGVAPHREATIYRIIELMGMPGYKARPAFFTYEHDGTPLFGHPMQAFFLENMDSVIARTSAPMAAGAVRSSEIGPAEADARKRKDDVRYEFDSVVDARGRALHGMDVTDAARIFFLEALVSNIDWAFKVKPMDGGVAKYKHAVPNLWNIKVVEMPQRNWVLFAYDFDIAGWVNETTDRSSLDEIRWRFDKRTVKQVKTEFLGKRQAIERVVDQLQNDIVGQRNMRAHVSRFYEAIMKF